MTIARHFAVPLTLLAILAMAAPAHAGEVFGGVYKHAVATPLSLEGGREQGVDFQLGFRGGRLFPGLGLQPYAFGALNSAGDTSYAAAGLSWKFGDKFFVRPGLGLAIHNGSAAKFTAPTASPWAAASCSNPSLALAIGWATAPPSKRTGST